MNSSEVSELKNAKLIKILSIVLPLAVAALFGIRIPNVEPLVMLPPIYAAVNALTAILLITAIIAIKKKKINAHKTLIKICMVLSALFLVMYVAYHMTSDTTRYQGNWSMLYYPVLFSHILLSVVIVPLVLVTYSRGNSNQVELHRKIAKITFPLWLYVAVSGVVVYFMIAPYYQAVN